jgi:hypothetical protein
MATLNNITNLTVRTYDEYLAKKLEATIMRDEDDKPLIDVIYAPFDLAFEYAMKRQQVENLNQIKFPMIICHRSAGFSISDMTHRVLSAKQPVYYIDYYTDADIPVKVSRYFQVVNVNIPYTIEILTKEETQAFELAQEIIFLLLREPFVDVPKYLSTSSVPTSEKTSFRFAMFMDNDIADNTALETESEAGKLYRLTISATISDAALSRDVRANMVETVKVDIIDGYPNSIPGDVFADEIIIE